MEKTFIHPVIGEIKIRRSLTSRAIRLYVHHQNGISITIPLFVSVNQAESFVNSKTAWITRALERQKKRAEKYNLHYRDGYSVKTLNGYVHFSLNNNRVPALTGSAFNKTIFYNSDTPRKAVTELFDKAIRKLASDYLPKRAVEIAEKHRFEYNRIFLKNNLSNWGSCSSKRNINLNIHLIRLPQELCDFIILHEMCHLKYRNHGEEFHTLLNSLCDGREKEFNKILKEYATRLI